MYFNTIQDTCIKDLGGEGLLLSLGLLLLTLRSSFLRRPEVVYNSFRPSVFSTEMIRLPADVDPSPPLFPLPPPLLSLLVPALRLEPETIIKVHVHLYNHYSVLSTFRGVETLSQLTVRLFDQFFTTLPYTYTCTCTLYTV